MGRGIIRSPIERFVIVVSIMGNVPRLRKVEKSSVFLLRRLKRDWKHNTEEASSQEIYARRKARVEHPWAH